MDYYVLECSARECVAEFYLNDIPVVRRGPDLGLHFAGQSNQYLVDGRNELSVLVEPGPTPGEAISGKGGARSRREAAGAAVSAALCKYPPGATVGGPLDVFDPEPLEKDSALRHLPNAFITPHIAWYAPHAFPRYFGTMAREFERYFRGEGLAYELTHRMVDIRRGRL